MTDDVLRLIPTKNPQSFTVTAEIKDTPDYMLNVDLDNMGDGDAIITNPDSSTWILRSGASKSIVTGFLLKALKIDATNTIVQVIYTV